MFGSSWKPDSGIGSLEGKTILVTGGSDGVGKESVLQFSKHKPDHIWLAARSQSKSEAAISEIKKTVPNANISFLQMDLTSFSSIKAAAAKVNADPSAQLHILMLNAGIMAVAPGLTEDGYEIQFGTNHVGHALLTKLLLPTLRKTAASDANADVRIVTLASEAENKMPTQGPGINLDGIKKADGGGLSTFQRYSQSKIANVLYTRALAQREVAVDEGKSNRIKHIVVHPGMVKTNLANGLMKDHPWLSLPLKILLVVPTAPFLVSPEQGARNQLWAATSPDAKSGSYYHPVGREVPGSQFSCSEELREKLWSWTEEELGERAK